jgi:hypothetical protein
MSDQTITEQVLGKRIESLEYSDVVEYFKTPRKESDRREFKASVEGTKLEKDQVAAIYRSICAFLNSEGGLLLWGAPIGKSNGTGEEDEFQGDLTQVFYDYGDDQLSNMLFDSLNPRPQGVRHRKLENGTRRLYVFEVPKSTYSPHQVAKSGTYYFRFNATTRPAPHYLVEALMRRVSFPNIGAYLKPTALQTSGPDLQLLGEVLVINHSPLQNERDITIYLSTSQGKFGGQVFGIASNRKYLNGSSELRLENHITTLHYGVIHREVIEIRMPIAAKGSTLKLTVSAGGLYSPLKGSTYTIALNTDLGAKNLITSMSENYEFHETLGDMKSSSSAVLKQALGRQE